MHKPEEFNEIMRKYYPVAFGPLEFNCREFDSASAVDTIIKKLNREHPEIEKVCIHGQSLEINGRRLKSGV